IGGEVHETEALIIATGASAKMLGLESEQKLLGRGVSTCATCDGAFFRDRKIAVVGGGDSAMEEATFLTKFASQVTIIHRRDALRASKVMQDRAQKNPKIQFLWNTTVDEVLGVEAGKVTGLRLRNVHTDERSDFACDGLFIAIGHTPNTKIFADYLDLDEKGYIKVEGNTSETKIPGVFVAGDVHDLRYRQAITAAGAGCKAALDAERWLESQH
ncbi:MAG TPA: FAD-dependent oxidoreductase, partial [Limnochordia bacterium]|nr:FAD-dependent oxidoreductase [Limnochordia bacterium]